MRPAAAVGDRQIEGLGERRNFNRFGVPADRANVGLGDVDCVIGNQLAMTKPMTLVLAGCNGNRRMAAQIGEQSGIVLINRFFKPRNGAGLDAPTEFERPIERE